MIPITDNVSAAEAKYALELALLKNSCWQLWAGEQLLMDLPETRSYELSVEWGKLIFSWWNEAAAQSWRVTSYAITPNQIQLRVSRSFGRDLTTLSLRSATAYAAGQVAADATAQRQTYAELVGRLLSQHFAATGLRVLPSASPSLPGATRYSRFWLEQGRTHNLVIGIGETAPQSEIDGIVATGLLWLANTTQAPENAKPVQRLCFCLPPQRSQTVLERLSLLVPQPFGAKIECLEVDLPEQRLIPRSLATQAELINHHVRELCWPESSPPVHRWRERICQLAPELIEVRLHPQLAAESFCIHGLEFARANLRGLEQVSFGVAGIPPEFGYPTQQTLSERNFAQLAALVQEIKTQRVAQAANRQHPYYRLRAEAWLESLLRRELHALDAQLDERFVYSQIPAWRAEERSVLDLLTVTRTGRLVVIEIKASEDIQLPFQGLDYWLRVEQARVRGELEQRGLFPGVRLVNQPPLLYLVAPRLRFHRSFVTLARCLAPEVEAYRLGLNTNWRAGIRVHTRERLNADESL